MSTDTIELAVGQAMVTVIYVFALYYFVLQFVRANGRRDHSKMAFNGTCAIIVAATILAMLIRIGAH